MVKGIVESHEGSIEVKSLVNSGTTFSILLPASLSDRNDDLVEDKPALRGVGHILFIDDEPSLVKMGAKIVKSLGYNVTPMTSSREALEFFKENSDNIDLVITDMAMPNLTGDALALEMRKIRADIPVILCTGYSSTINTEKTKLLGIEAFLYKPIEKIEISRTIKELLENC